MENIVIREARANDAGAILAFLKQVGGESDNLTFGSEGLPFSEEDEAKYLESVFNDSHSVSFIATIDDEIVGDASLAGLPRRMGHRAELGIAVLRKIWNIGIGGKLLERIIEYAKSNEIEIINLEVREDNCGAIHLYEKYGFKRIGVSPAFQKINGEYIDFILMYLDLRADSKTM